MDPDFVVFYVFCGWKKTTARKSRPETVRPTISPTGVKEIKILDV